MLIFIHFLINHENEYCIFCVEFFGGQTLGFVGGNLNATIPNFAKMNRSLIVAIQTTIIIATAKMITNYRIIAYHFFR